jgi:hypothetical protein
MTGDSENLRVPSTATPQEAAAITAAVHAHLAAEEAAAEEAATEAASPTWDGKRFQFAGRIAAVTGTPRRVPRGAPTDEWTALGRSDRFQR